jgi:membrane-bound lytic murein transglycosylase
VLRGALERKWAKKHVEPLVWLTRNDVEQALMQGSMFVRMPDGKTRLFNVHEKNNKPYIKSIKDRRKQTLYWYFRDIKSKKNVHEKKLLDFISLGGATFAGDLKNVGAGKFVAIEYINVQTKKKELKIGILADSGSAFLNNWNQLDLFAGIFDTHWKFKRYIRQFPDAVTAYILKRKL